MPIYEFRCTDCATEFEGLFAGASESPACPNCGSGRTVRRYSAIGRPLHLVKTTSENRKQERKNAELQATARQRFKQARRGTRKNSDA